jgi:hypothetical protein
LQGRLSKTAEREERRDGKTHPALIGEGHGEIGERVEPVTK